MTRYQDYCARQRQRHGAQFTEVGLDPRFVPAYNAGALHRVKVRFSYGAEAWGYVAATTGWRPSFMLMRHRRQHGSHELLGAGDVILAERELRA